MNKFKVYVWRNTRTKEVTSMSVNNGLTPAEAEERPNAATFPVSVLFDEKTQGIRAQKFADYLNSLVDLQNDLEKDQTI
jgi:hypothetical protein